MDKNLVAAVVLTTLIILLFSSPLYQSKFGKPLPARPAGTMTAQTDSSGARRDSAMFKSPTERAPAELAPAAPRQSGASVTAAVADTTLRFAQPLHEEARAITLKNDDIEVTLTTQGGLVSGVEMKRFTGATSNERAQLVPENTDWLDGFVYEGDDGMPMSAVSFRADSVTVRSVLLTADFNGGRAIHRTFSLEEKGFRLATTTTFTGGWNDPGVTYMFRGALNRTEPKFRQLRIWPFSMFMQDQDNMYDKLVYLGQGERFTEENGKKKEKRIYSREGNQSLQAKSGGSGSDTFQGDLDWLAIKNKYFMAAAIPTENRRWTTATDYDHDQNGNHFAASISKKVSDGDTGLSIYMGPVSFQDLKTQGHNLTQVMDLSWRWLRPLAILFLWLLRKIHMVIPNWGLVLIVFSLLIKVALAPLSKSSTKSMKKMQQLQPQIALLREKYKTDPQKLNKATMDLYKQEGVNPFGGCLPLLLQMPVFFALYPVVGSAFELRQAMFIPRWVEDLSRPDPYYILPIAMGVSMFFQSKSTVTDPNQKAMIYMMPVLMVVFFANVSSGLTLYWLMFNILSWAQQEYMK